MLHAPSANLAYFHIHKTGGTSLKAYFRCAFPDAVEIGHSPHLSLAQYFDLLKEKGVDHQRIRIVTTIRDPFAHLVSIYHFWGTKVGHEDRREHIDAARTMSFAR